MADKRKRLICGPSIVTRGPRLAASFRRCPAARLSSAFPFGKDPCHGLQQAQDESAIPPTLQQSLTARLDRLGPAREVAQIGAVIGRDFSYALLRAVAGTDDAALQAALDRLAEADILLVQGLSPDADYRFKHALLQDAAYGSVTPSIKSFDSAWRAASSPTMCRTCARSSGARAIRA